MGLFEKFRETIFLKSDSELEKKAETLKKSKEKYPDNKDIQHDLFMIQLGLIGEKEITYELKNANIGMYVLRDLNIAINDYKAQIDYVVITPGYTYFIECKNLIGNITVNENGDFIREYTYKDKKIKKGIYSPIRQVDRQKEIYKKIWADNRGKLVSSLFDSGFEKHHKTLVVMANKENILNTRYAPKDIKDKIIRSDSLIRYINNDINKISRDFLNSKKDMERIANWFLSINIPVIKDYEAEYDLTNEKATDYIKEKLLEFRTNTSKEKKIPAYYVFTNEELENLIKHKPKSIEEIRNLKILPEVKIKVHGEKIISIINS